MWCRVEIRDPPPVMEKCYQTLWNLSLYTWGYKILSNSIIIRPALTDMVCLWESRNAWISEYSKRQIIQANPIQLARRFCLLETTDLPSEVINHYFQVIEEKYKTPFKVDRCSIFDSATHARLDFSVSVKFIWDTASTEQAILIRARAPDSWMLRTALSAC